MPSPPEATDVRRARCFCSLLKSKPSCNHLTEAAFALFSSLHSQPGSPDERKLMTDPFSDPSCILPAFPVRPDTILCSLGFTQLRSEGSHSYTNKCNNLRKGFFSDRYRGSCTR